jgi:prolyl oligopeptidase
VDVLHGHTVNDPYRWLEDRQDERTVRWAELQDRTYAEHLSGWPGRERLRARLDQLHKVGAVDVPVWRRGRWFATRRDAGRDLATLYTGCSRSERQVLVDPMTLNPSGCTTLGSWEPDHDGRRVAYEVSANGTEEPVLFVADVDSGRVVDGPIDRVRHGCVAWLPGGDAFFYVRRMPPDQVPSGEEQFHRRVYLHRVGEPASQDIMIFGDGRDKTNLYRLWSSPDGRWLVIRAARGTAPRNDVWIADLRPDGPEKPDLHVVQEDVDGRTMARVGPDGRLYLFTDVGSPRRRLAVADPEEPAAPWLDLLPEDDVAVLTDYALVSVDGSKRLLVAAARARHAVSEIAVHDAVSGALVDTVALPGLGTVTALAEQPSGSGSVWFDYTDYATAQTVWRYDARTRSAEPWWPTPGSAGPLPVETRQVDCRSKDGTTVRLFVVARPEVLDDRVTHPAILNGYGGFGVSLTPRYTPSLLAWVEAGGIYAVAGVRGGGEEGESWHRAGIRENKQNAFDDFLAAADSLITSGWTKPEQLAVTGASNGGLLVGVALTQQPARFAAVLCQAPLLDMIRYERPGLGRMWTAEYGTAADPEQFAWLLSYSPYHHVHDGVGYPAVVFSTYGNDTRVDAMHAWKMCAALQHATSSIDRPILLRRESNVGHGTRAVSSSVAHGAEALAFIAAHTGLAV